MCPPYTLVADYILDRMGPKMEQRLAAWMAVLLADSLAVWMVVLRAALLAV